MSGDQAQAAVDSVEAGRCASTARQRPAKGNGRCVVLRTSTPHPRRTWGWWAEAERPPALTPEPWCPACSRPPFLWCHPGDRSSPQPVPGNVRRGPASAVGAPGHFSASEGEPHTIHQTLSGHLGLPVLAAYREHSRVCESEVFVF